MNTSWIEGPLADAFKLGVAEAGGDVGMTYDNDAESPRSVAYDVGRTVGQLPEPWRSRLAAAPELVEMLDVILHIAETPGDFTTEELLDFLGDAGALLARIRGET